MNDAVVTILEFPLIARVSVVLFIIWLAYVIIGGRLIKISVIIPMLFNWIWIQLYRLIGGITHILHKNFGKPFRGIDQTVSDFFGSVYMLMDKIKTIIKGTAGRPFVGTTFVILVILTIWVALPTWVDSPRDDGLFCMPYRRYISIENRLADWLLGN